ncbi:MAG: NADH-quinone oxidoreductase subunit NuoF [bacterium]
MVMDLEHPREQPFEPKLLSTTGLEESYTLDVYEDNGGYEQARRVLNGDLAPHEIEEIVKESGLKGRGGAGFPTGMKWSFVPDNDQQKYLVCNADESEPGTFKDRVILEQKPHLLLEGMLLSAYALDATVGFIYIRGEYRSAYERLKGAIEEAEKAGYLGSNVFGSDFDFNLHLNRGAGAYIVGEETALLNSLEGKRGVPRKKPPFPAVEGLFGQPTVVNNVETLSNVPLLVENGADWYRQWGTEDDPGFRLFSICGSVKRPGVYEAPLGTPLEDLIEDYCGGIERGRETKAVIPGGSSTPPIRGDQIDVKMDSESIQEVGSRLGSGGVIVFDETVCMPQMATRLAHFYAHESCGWCTPCREGVPWLEDMLDDIEKGIAPEKDYEKIKSISSNIDANCFCPLGPSASTPVLQMFDYWGEEFEYHMEHGECDIPDS